jgi:hypothetical protein
MKLTNVKRSDIAPALQLTTNQCKNAAVEYLGACCVNAYIPV